MFSYPAPCVPLSVTPVVDCNSSVVSISWGSALGATGYRAQVLSISSGHRSSCNSMSTQCSFSDLGCGQEYTATIQSLHEECVSAVSAPVIFSTGKGVGREWKRWKSFDRNRWD